jgi:fructokinase
VTPGLLFGGVEAGGTKFICMVGSGPENVQAQVRIATTTPAETLAKVIHFFEPYVRAGEIHALGVGSFGPLDLEVEYPKYGFITNTPKPGWHDADMVAPLQTALQLKVALDTDVNSAALGEFVWGANRGMDPSLYLTVGTGVGAGFIKDGKPLRGLLHPEMGHIPLHRDPERDPFPGSCPFHGDCLEGLASGPAIARKFGVPAERLPDDHPYWDLEAGYIASALASYVLILSPRRIAIGGGILQRRFLLPMIRRKLLASLGGYVRSAEILDRVDEYVVSPALGDRSGVLGALALAAQLG